MLQHFIYIHFNPQCYIHIVGQQVVDMVLQFAISAARAVDQLTLVLVASVPVLHP